MKNSLSTKRNIIIIFIAFILVCILSFFLNNDIFIEKIDNREELNIVYSDIIERNKKMLEKPVEYGDEYCSGYVSTQKNFELHKTILEEVQLLSNEICVGAESDYEKIKAIAYYVAKNVYYNHVAAEESVTAETISIETVLKTKTATCAGYSNLFSALCNMQGIYCVNLRGGTYIKDYFSSKNLLDVPINHEWNAVLIGNEWIFVDVTWLSNNKYTEYGYETADFFDDQYFGMSLEEMSYEHRIDIIDYRNFKSSINAFSK